MSLLRGAVIVVRNEKNELLLLRRSAQASHHRGMWENPGGKCNPGESFEQAARRELQEEAGLCAEYPLEQLNEKIYHDQECSQDFEVVIFGYSTSTDPKIIESTFDEWRWVAVDRLSSLALAPYVVDDFRQLGLLE